MTREEAIEILKDVTIEDWQYGDYEALDMAVEALEHIEALEHDEIIHCEDCIYCNRDLVIRKMVTGIEDVVNECILLRLYVEKTDYCSFAEKRESDGE